MLGLKALDLKIMPHYLLAYILSDEKSTIIITLKKTQNCFSVILLKFVIIEDRIMTFSIGISNMYKCNSFNNNDIMTEANALSCRASVSLPTLRPIERDNITYSKTSRQHALK